MWRAISREEMASKLSVLARHQTHRLSLRCGHWAGCEDRVRFRTTREAPPSAFNWLSSPPSLVAASGSTGFDTQLRARVHPHQFVFYACVLYVGTTSASHYIQSSTYNSSFVTSFFVTRGWPPFCTPLISQPWMKSQPGGLANVCDLNQSSNLTTAPLEQTNTFRSFSIVPTVISRQHLHRKNTLKFPKFPMPNNGYQVLRSRRGARHNKGTNHTTTVRGRRRRRNHTV